MEVITRYRGPVLLHKWNPADTTPLHPGSLYWTQLLSLRSGVRSESWDEESNQLGREKHQCPMPMLRWLLPDTSETCSEGKARSPKTRPHYLCLTQDAGAHLRRTGMEADALPPHHNIIWPSCRGASLSGKGGREQKHRKWKFTPNWLFSEEPELYQMKKL